MVYHPDTYFYKYYIPFFLLYHISITIWDYNTYLHKIINHLYIPRIFSSYQLPRKWHGHFTEIPKYRHHVMKYIINNEPHFRMNKGQRKAKCLAATIVYPLCIQKGIFFGENSVQHHLQIALFFEFQTLKSLDFPNIYWLKGLTLTTK